jgi:predicted RNase H-like nuclease (RuvC/YqgF family)
MPVLTNTRDSLTKAKERAEERHARAAQGDQKTRELGNQLASLRDERIALAADLERQETEIEEFRARKTALEEAMRKSQRVASLLDRRDALEKDIEALKLKVAEKQADMGGSMSTAWCALIGDRMRAAVTALKDKENSASDGADQD